MANLNKIVYLSEEQKTQLFANNTISVSGITVNYNDNDLYIIPEGDTLENVNLKLTGTSNQLLTCTSDRTSYAGASGETPRYIPGKWRLNAGADPVNGNIYVFQTPEASTGAGIYLSVNGTETANYHPVLLNTTAIMTTHFAAGTTLMVVYEANSIGSAYEIEPTDNDKSNVTGVFRVINFYDANTNTLLRTYASSSANELPIPGMASSTSMGIPTHTSSYKDIYGGIPATAANRPVIKLSTGVLRAPAGIELGTNKSKLGNLVFHNTSNTSKITLNGSVPSADITITMPSSSGTLALTSDLNSKQATITASGILKGNGSGTISAATAGTDYAAPNSVVTQASVDSNGLVSFKNSSGTAQFTLQLPLYGGGVS